MEQIESGGKIITDRWTRMFLDALHYEDLNQYDKTAEIYQTLIKEKIETPIRNPQLVSARQIDFYVDHLSSYYKKKGEIEKSINILKHYFSSSLPKECFGTTLSTNLKLEKRLVTYQIHASQRPEFVPWNNNFGHNSPYVPEWSVQLRINLSSGKSNKNLVEWYEHWHACEKSEDEIKLTFLSNEIVQFFRASNMAGNSKAAKAFISGNAISNMTAFRSALRCFSNWEQHKSSPDYYCYSVENFGENLFGCKLFSKLREESRWWLLGEFSGATKYRFKTEEIKRLGETYWKQFCGCPLARREKVEFGLGLMPKEIDFAKDNSWDKSGIGKSIVPISLDRYFPIQLSDSSVFLYNLSRPYIEAVSVILGLNLPETLLLLLKKSKIKLGMRFSVNGLAGSFEDVVRLYQKLLKKMYLDYLYVKKKPNFPYKQSQKLLPDKSEN